MFSIGELLNVGVDFSLCVFWTALSIFCVDIVDANFEGISGLFGDVTMKLFLFSDVNTFMGLFCVESDSVMISTVGDFSNSFSSIFMKDLFCCLSMWIFDCWSAAARDFARNVSSGFCLPFRFPAFF